VPTRAPPLGLTGLLDRNIFVLANMTPPEQGTVWRRERNMQGQKRGRCRFDVLWKLSTSWESRFDPRQEVFGRRKKFVGTRNVASVWAGLVALDTVIQNVDFDVSDISLLLAFTSCKDKL